MVERDALDVRVNAVGFLRPRTRGIVVAIALGILAAAIGVLVAAFVDALTDDVVYAPLIGAVVVAIWAGGGIAGIAAVATGWPLALWILAPPGYALDAAHGALVPWAASLATAIVIGSVAFAMRRRHERTADVADQLERSYERVERLQELAALLSAALTPEQVAGVMVERVPATIGARGGALGLLEGGELVIVDPDGARGQTIPPRSRLPLTLRAPIVQAAREGRPAWAQRRREFVSEFPDGAALASHASGALAVPVFVGDRLVGAMGFPFDHPDAVSEEVRTMARIAAELGGQALERAALYAQESASRESLDRILAVAPRFLRASKEESLVAAVCNEARRTFGCDIAQIWIPVDGREIEVAWRVPASPILPPGTRIALDDFPGMHETLSALVPMFVPNAQEHTRGDALRHARELGLFSSLRVPIVIGGQFERILVLQWERVIPEPSPSTMAVIRRFADQAGLAIEQADRRRAQELTRALQIVTEALAVAATPEEVGRAIVRQGAEALGADTATVYGIREDEDTLELVASRGYSSNLRNGPPTVIPMGDDASPVTRAVRERGRVIWTAEQDEVSDSPPAVDGAEESCVALPLFVAGRIVGAMSVGTFDEPEDAFDHSTLVALARQAAQALDRAQLFEREQRSADRLRKLQAVTAGLSSAVWTRDVCRTCLSHAAAGVSSDQGLIVLRQTDAASPTIFATIGLGHSPSAVPEGAVAPIAACMRSGRPAAAESGWLALPLGSGALALRLPDDGPLDARDQEWLLTLSSQGTQALDRAGRYEAERGIAETLQRSMLPDRLPNVHGAEFAARYLPGTDGVDVGGDWYDAIVLEDGRVGLVIGDVVGKGVLAASLMGQLRNALRAFASEYTDPDLVVSRLRKLVAGAHEVPFATLAYLVVDTDRRRVRYVLAGHPPPLVLQPDGTTSFLEGGRGLPIGVDGLVPLEAGEAEFDAGSAIVLFTDGLVERRDRPLDDGMHMLAEAARRVEGDPEDLVDGLVGAMLDADDRPDDVAVVVVRFSGSLVDDLDLAVPATQDGLVQMRQALRDWLAAGPVGAAAASDVVLAVWEAGANAIEHAELPSEPTFGLVARLDDAARLKVEVRDSGRWNTTNGSGTDRGLGLGLMRSLMDDVTVRPSPTGTTVVLERRMSLEGDV